MKLVRSAQVGELHDLVAPERDPEKEPQRRDGLIKGR